MDLEPAAGFEHRHEELGLAQGLAAGEGHTALGLLIEWDVSFDGADQFGYGHWPAGALACLGRAGVHTPAAVRAPGRIGRDTLRGAGEGLVRAGFNTDAAVDAAVGDVNLARNVLPVFRVVAPPAAEGAAFQEHGRPDAWTVMGGEPHDIEDLPGGGFGIHGG
jgi:hypothetical protein